MRNHKPTAADLTSVVLTHPNLRPSVIATAQGVSRQRVSAAGIRAGVKHRAGRPPTDALTPRSARSKRLVAALAAVAEAWSLTPEDVLLRLAAGGIADPDPALEAKLKVVLEVS